MDAFFSSISNLIKDVGISFQDFEIINEGYLSSTCKLERNTK